MRAVTPPPEAEPILAGLQSQSREFARGFRPTGTSDWLLVCTLGGLGHVRAAGQVRTLRPGDMLLFAPGSAQDYGYLADDSDWSNIWVHFRPRPQWLPWMVWPAVAPGVMVLPGTPAGAVEAALHQLVEAAASPIRLRHDLALNLLERVLILCDAVNPNQRHATLDPRIRQALGLIGERLKAPPDIGTLSRGVGLSRSRFSVLFKAEMKVTPQTYVELTRLARAAQLLALSGWTIGQVAQEAGFADPYYFSARFRARYGTAPSQYRQKLRGSG